MEILKLRVDGANILETVMPPKPAKRDRSKDPEIGKAAILAALKNVGVEAGDTLLVHSSLSACGHVVGGAQTIIEALIEAVGPNGNFFVPTFQRSECYLNGINKRWDHRPSDFRDRSSEAVARGLEIRRAPLGVGELKLIDCRRFWDVGSALVREEPRIIIGDV